ncbi:hypothetical protein [Sodalis sp.]|uniref:hypothetical protein n=1 Tax=Sodalis sp. (in: enterobacteria) TaxID=1898979 RepID=UPI003872ADC5
MPGSCNIASGKNSFAIHITSSFDANPTKSPLTEKITSVANSANRMASSSASENARNVAGGEGASSTSSRAADVRTPSVRINEGQEEAITPLTAFLNRPIQKNLTNLLNADPFFGQPAEIRNRVQNDLQEPNTDTVPNGVEQPRADNSAQSENTDFSKATTLIKTFFSRFSANGEVPDKLSKQEVMLLKEHGAAVLANLKEEAVRYSKEAWIKAHPGEDITKQPIFDFQYDSCLDQIEHAVQQLQTMPVKNVTGHEMAGIFGNAFAAITTIPHTLIYLAPSQPASANPGPDVKAGPAAERGVSIGNIETHQGDNTYHYHYHYPSGSPGNENVGGKLSSNDASNSASSTEQMKRDAPPAAEPGSSTTTTNRAETKDKSTEIDSPADGAKGHGKQLRDMFVDSQPLTPRGNDEPDANNNRLITDDEQFIDSSKFSPGPRETQRAELKINIEDFDEQPKGNDVHDANNNRLITGDEQFLDSSKFSYGAREIKRALLQINADGFDELPKGYEPAFANKVVSVTMKNKANTLFSQPQNAIQPRYASNLRPSRPLGQKEVGNVAETPRGEIKGVKALVDFFENEAFKDRNGLVLDNGSAHNRSSGYESADDDSVADMSDVESYLSTDDDRYGDAVRRNNRPLMNSSSADDSSYDSDGSTNDSLSTKDLYHARRVQVDETDASRDETDSVTLGTDEISEVKKKIALFNKENVVATKPTPKEYQFKVKESDRVHLSEAKAITLSTSGIFKK